MVELTTHRGSQRAVLDLIGLSRSSWHYRHHPRPTVEHPVHQADRAYGSRISGPERDQIEADIRDGWTQGLSVDHSFAVAWDAGIMLASRRTWWRIANEIEDQDLRPVVPTRVRTRTPRQKPVLRATGPGQVWSWDITDLYAPWVGKTFKAYKIIDIFSRNVVGHCVHEREANHLAVALFRETIALHGAPDIVHADSGPAMISSALKEFLTDEGVELTHNRPYVSNDNPFSEASFRTMKYRPGYPGVFTDLEAARTYVDEYVQWYNTEHRHSGIALFTPAQVHHGTWVQAWQVRDNALQAYHLAHPERFHRRPITKMPATIVGINLPKPLELITE